MHQSSPLATVVRDPGIILHHDPIHAVTEMLVVSAEGRFLTETSSIASSSHKPQLCTQALQLAVLYRELSQTAQLRRPMAPYFLRQL